MSAAFPSRRVDSSITLDRVSARTRSSPRVRTSRAALEARFARMGDFAVIWVSAAFALSLRVDIGAISYGTMLAKNAGFMILFSILVILFAQAQRLYDAQLLVALDEVLAILKAVALGAIVLSASIYLSGQKVVSRVALGTTVVTSAVLLVSWRRCRRRRLLKRAAAGHDCRNVLIFGWSEPAKLLQRHFLEHGIPGYIIKGFLDRRRSVAGRPGPVAERRRVSVKAVGHIDELPDLVRAHFIDEILVFLPEDRGLVKRVIMESRNSGVDLRVIPDFYDGLALGAPIQHLGPFPTIQMHEQSVPIFSLVLKRIVDVFGSGLALILCMPLFAILALVIRLDSPGRILYRSRRIGKKGRVFWCYKFRTMVENADELKEQLQDLNERKGVLFKIANDPRITQIGRLLRKYSLDEIPQFWNVLTGDMSLVGPRPPIPGEYLEYELSHLKRHHVSPGITGLWQVEGRADPSFESYINLDTYYVENWSMWLDLQILFKTVSVVFAGTGQ